jgi:hypothetical protein
VAMSQPVNPAGRPDVFPRSMTLLGTCILVIALSGCSGSAPKTSPTSAPPPTAVFDDQGGQAISCLNHQTQAPSPAYQAGPSVVSELELPMLAYYTRNGNQPYCDNRPATPTDLSWLTTYVQDGADPSHVRAHRP